jgi:hypothetical protein
MRFDLAGDLLALGENGLDRETGRGAELIQRIQVERVARGDAQSAVFALQRKQRVPVDQLERKTAEQGQIDVVLLEVDKWDAALIAQCLERSLLADQAEIDRGNVKSLCLGPVDAKLRKLLWRQQPAFDKN